mgnify:CR=1 FL=1
MADFLEITTQEELDRIIQDRLARQEETLRKKYEEEFSSKYSDYDDLKKQSAKSSELQEELNKLTEANKAYEDQVSGLNQKVTSYETEKLKAEIALKQGLPFELSSRLVGGDEKEIRQDAERLSALLKSAKPVAPGVNNEPNVSTDSVEGGLQQLVNNLNNHGE